MGKLLSGATPARGPRFAIEPLEERVAPTSYVLDLGPLDVELNGSLENVHLKLTDVYLTQLDGSVLLIDKLQLHFHDPGPADPSEPALQNVHVTLDDVYLIGPNVQLTI